MKQGLNPLSSTIFKCPHSIGVADKNKRLFLPDGHGNMVKRLSADRFADK